MVLTARTYEQVALEDDMRQWELHAGQLVEKPATSVMHGHQLDRLYFILATKLDRAVYEIRATMRGQRDLLRRITYRT